MAERARPRYSVTIKQTIVDQAMQLGEGEKLSRLIERGLELLVERLKRKRANNTHVIGHVDAHALTPTNS